MIGAITGDVVGSRFEMNDFRSKEFEMFHTECFFTDDTVMTLAVAKSLMNYQKEKDTEEYKKELVEIMHEVGSRYPGCGYGGKFYDWIVNNRTEPYNSFGNGSAMRVSPVAWVCASLEECERLAKLTAEVTHNHPEGIKGAVAVAGAIYLARTKSTKAEIREYVKGFYNIDFTLDEIRDNYVFSAACQTSVPEAIEAFLESDSFEDAIRCAISIGGDSDTIAAIAGSIAEAFYGTDEEIKETALSFLDEYLSDIACAFIEKYLS